MDSWGVDPQTSPLAADWGQYFRNQAPDNIGWWASESSAPYSYSQGWSRNSGLDYHPGGRGEIYDPESGFGWQSTIADIDRFMLREFPELSDFSTAGWQTGGVGSVGQVAKDPGFGQFNKTPAVYAEMQAAAQKYGVPVNFLQAIIAKESSGDWASNSMVKHARGMRIHGYIGVFENAAKAWGFDFDRGIGNRAYQIEMLAGGLRRFYDQLHGQNPNYGWLNVAAYHYSGDPTGGSTPNDSWQHGSTQNYMAETQAWWQRLDRMAGNTWSNFSDIGQQTGIGSPQTEKWAPVNRYDNFVSGASQKYGVPANLIKAIMQFESNGNPNVVSPQGATGLMQVMPFHVNGNQAALYDPATNIDVGTRILMENYGRYGTWDMAAKAYLGFGVDAHGTTPSVYWSRVKANWDELNAGGSGMFGGQSGGGGLSLGMDGIWGGREAGISQEFGRTAWSTGDGAWMYDYAAGLGIPGGHPGLDISMPMNTPLYSPVSGTVIRSGGSGSFYNTVGQRYSSGSGELRIRLDNGHEVILGHMSQINVTPGTRVTPGMAVGVSGYPAGPHLHLEYRIPGQQTSTGWRAVDPRQYLTGGIIPGAHQEQYTGLGSQFMPMTYNNLLLAAAKGMPIPKTGTYASGGGSNSWNSYLRTLMSGQIPRTTSYTYTGPRGTTAPVLTGNE
jgi:hypothetical protein